MTVLVDVICSVFLIGGFAALAGAYAVRVALMGRARYERIEQVGGSVLLGERAMTMVYWGLQGAARACVALGLTPNKITALTLAAATAAAAAAATGHFGVALAALLAGTLGDALDGLVARVSGQTSRAGAVFDSVADRYGEGVYLFGLGYYFRGNAALLSLVFAAWMGSFMVSYVSAKAEALRIDAPRGLMRRTERAVYLAVATGITPFTQLFVGHQRADVVGTFPLVAALTLIGVVANLSAVHRLASMMKTLELQERAAPAPEARERVDEGAPLGKGQRQAA